MQPRPGNRCVRNFRVRFKANLRLRTIYQKLGDLVRSDEALNEVIAAKGLGLPGSFGGPGPQRQHREDTVAEGF